MDLYLMSHPMPTERISIPSRRRPKAPILEDGQDPPAPADAARPDSAASWSASRATKGGRSRGAIRSATIAGMRCHCDTIASAGSASPLGEIDGSSASQPGEIQYFQELKGQVFWKAVAPRRRCPIFARRPL